MPNACEASGARDEPALVRALTELAPARRAAFATAYAHASSRSYPYDSSSEPLDLA